MDIRCCPINFNYWYAIASSQEVRNEPIGVILWHKAIVIYRDSNGKINALEDRCPHRQVKLSHGKVITDAIECTYHGWQFNNKGECTLIPYLASHQKLPSCSIEVYPAKELNGFIWIYLGDKNNLKTEKIEPLVIPEWDHLNYIATVSTIDCRGHFSFLIENLMDMYHGHLHNNYQAWTSAKLKHLTSEDHKVEAEYEAQSYYKIDQIWSISQLFFPSLRRLHPEPLKVSYLYPNWRSTLGQDFVIYCLFCPINQTHTRAFLIHFTSLNAFWRLHKLPIKFRRGLKNRLYGSAQKLLDGLVAQDVKMIEQEQQAYLKDPQSRTYEVNPTLGKVQQLIDQEVKKI